MQIFLLFGSPLTPILCVCIIYYLLRFTNPYNVRVCMENQEMLQGEIDTMLKNIELYANAIIREVNQKRSGGFFSLDYIDEKCRTIKSLAEGVKQDERLLGV